MLGLNISKFVQKGISRTRLGVLDRWRTPRPLNPLTHKMALRPVPSPPNTFSPQPSPLLLASLPLSLTTLSTLIPPGPMLPILGLMTVQTALGALDNILHHELTERLPWKATARREQVLHALRGLLYTAVFAALAGVTPHGAYAQALLAVLALEGCITMADFITEDRTRRLPATERVAHTLLTLNYGAVLALWVPLICSDWVPRETGIALQSYGLFSALFGAAVPVLFLWGVRDGLAARRLKRFAALPLPRLGLKGGRQRVLVTGGTGFIGSRLCKVLLNEGHDVTILARDRSKVLPMLEGSPGKLTLIDNFDRLDPSKDTYDVIVNLAGEPLAAQRWTAAHKERMFASRVGTTKKLVDLVARMADKPRVLVSGSAIGYYGVGVGDAQTPLGEDSAPVERASLSHRLCAEWEEAAAEAEKVGVRVVQLRTGIVLGREGGVMSQLLTPFEFGLGGPMGPGRHIMPWIHIDDMIGLIGAAIDQPSLRGPINATAPHPVTNADFTRTLASVMKRPAVVRLFSWQLKGLFGRELTEELLLSGHYVVPNKLQGVYHFKYDSLRAAFSEIVKGEDGKMG